MVQVCGGKTPRDDWRPVGRFPLAGWTAAARPRRLSARTPRASYHAVATDDGRIVAAEKAARCARSGHLVLAEELVECDATGERVLPELTRICPVTDRPVLATELTTLLVVLAGGQPMAVEGSLPGLPFAAADRRRRAAAGASAGGTSRIEAMVKWKAAETAEVHLLLATRWWRRLLLVVDKETSAVRHIRVGDAAGQAGAVPVDNLDGLR